MKKDTQYFEHAEDKADTFNHVSLAQNVNAK